MEMIKLLQRKFKILIKRKQAFHEFLKIEQSEYNSPKPCWFRIFEKISENQISKKNC